MTSFYRKKDNSTYGQQLQLKPLIKFGKYRGISYIITSTTPINNDGICFKKYRGISY